MKKNPLPSFLSFVLYAAFAILWPRSPGFTLWVFASGYAFSTFLGRMDDWMSEQ